VKLFTNAAGPGPLYMASRVNSKPYIVIFGAILQYEWPWIWLRGQSRTLILMITRDIFIFRELVYTVH